MNKDLVSVIVPVYNVESYLEKSLNSIINQTYHNLEIILVDDGSTDNCGAICDSYNQKDKRIQVIHRKNGGLSVARNTGLERATGEYIVFIDSDDFIAENMVEKLLGYIYEYDCDIVVCSYETVKEDAGIRSFQMDDIVDIKVLTRDEVYENLGTANRYRWFEPQVWNKMYRTEVIEGLRFEEGKYCEDQFYSHLSYEKANKIAFTSEKLYYYVERSNSISGTFSIKMLDAIEGMETRVLFAKERQLTLLESNTCAAVLDLLMRYWNLAVGIDDKMAKGLRIKFRECMKRYGITRRGYSILRYIKYYLFAINPRICSRLLMLLYGARK